MEKLSRRKLIAQVSVGAGVAGILAACSSSTDVQTTVSAGSTPVANTPAVTIPAGDMSAQPLAIFVTDSARGTIVIIRGDKETTINNPTLAQTLLAL